MDMSLIKTKLKLTYQNLALCQVSQLLSKTNPSMRLNSELIILTHSVSPRNTCPLLLQAKFDSDLCEVRKVLQSIHQPFQHQDPLQQSLKNCQALDIFRGTLGQSHLHL